MHISIERSELLTMLKRTGVAITEGKAEAYKLCVLIDGAAMTFRKTGDALSVLCKAAGNSHKPGRALLNHRRLSSIVNELPPGMVDITLNDKLQAVVKSNVSKRKFNMPSHDPLDYPPVLDGDPGALLYTIESKIFQQNASEVAFGIDEDRTDGALLVPFGGNRFRLMTLGSGAFCSAIGWFAETASGASTDEVLLPRVLLAGASALPSDSTQVGIHVTQSRVALVTDKITVGCALLVTEMPRVWQFLLDSVPKEKRFHVSSEAYLASVKAVMAGADVVEGDEKFVEIHTAYRDGDCLVSTRQSEKNYGEDELIVSEPSQTTYRVAMNGQRLAKALRAFAPYDIDVFYEAVNGQQTLVLQNENLLVAMSTIDIIREKGAP